MEVSILKSIKERVQKKDIWAEIRAIHFIRGKVLHRAEPVEIDNAKFALNVLKELLENIFPQFIEHLGFHLHNGFNMCSDFHKTTNNKDNW
jgi:hypothetical protein